MLESRASSRELDLWVKIDTGMNRLGFDPEDFPSAMERLARTPGIAAAPTLVTHLACADDRRDPKTQEQLALFEAATAGRPGRRSIANSAAILSRPECHADWVRPGLMLYGLSPFADGCGADLGLRPVMGLLSAVIATRRVRAGQTVGYGGTWRAARDTLVAVVACGYADGYPRELGAQPMVQVQGQDALVIGTVSMDMLCVDVTQLPPVAIGDPVVMWGGTLTVEDLARRSGTVPYTIVCGVTQRVPRELR
jgi:alanine racemase